MKFATLPESAEHEFLDDLNANRVSYGDANTYDSLLTISVPTLTRPQKQAVDEDLRLLWELYRTITELYVASVEGSEPPWLARLVEAGLSSAEISVHRATCQAGLEARLCRVDYVSLGDRRKLAEVQWKTGGPGLFVGIHDLHAAISGKYLTNAQLLGDFGHEFRAALPRIGSEGVAINDVRAMWLKGEWYLRAALGDDSYIPVSRTLLKESLFLSGGRLRYLEGGGGSRAVDAIHGQEFTNIIPENMLLGISELCLNSDLWIETPLNYIYRQKWGLALPFLHEFHSYFHDRLRDILPAAALINADPMCLQVLAASVDHPEADGLNDVTSILGIADLPSGLRKRLVFKCGAGNGNYYNRGRGVFRIGGSRSSARRILALIDDRVAAGEPWIVQEYVDETYRVPLAQPTSPLNFVEKECHARFMVYGVNDNGDCHTIGGLGNFGTDWKVSGRSWDGVADSFSGSAFSEIRYFEDDDDHH